MSWEAYPRTSPEAQISDKAETAVTSDSLGDLGWYRRSGPALPPGDAGSPAGGREPKLVGWGLRARSPTRPCKRWPARRAQRPGGGGARPAGEGVGALRAGRGWAPCSPFLLLPFLSFSASRSLSLPRQLAEGAVLAVFVAGGASAAARRLDSGPGPYLRAACGQACPESDPGPGWDANATDEGVR